MKHLEREMQVRKDHRLPLLKRLKTTEEDCLTYFEALENAFPDDWVRKTFENRLDPGRILTSLRPFVGVGRPTSHPVAHLLSHQTLGLGQLAEILRLGRDLAAVSRIRGVESIFERLRIVREYLGAFFELEILAALVRAGLLPELKDGGGHDLTFQLTGGEVAVEAKCIGPSDWMNTTHMIGSWIDDLLVDHPGPFQSFVVKLHSNKIQDAEFLKAFNAATATKQSFQNSAFSIEFLPGPPVSTYQIESPDGTYSEALEKRLWNTLHKKRKQLPLSTAAFRLVALDVRSVTIPYVHFKADNVKKLARECLRAAIDVCGEFLQKTSRVEGVLLWHRRELAGQVEGLECDEIILMMKDPALESTLRQSLTSARRTEELIWLH